MKLNNALIEKLLSTWNKDISLESYVSAGGGLYNTVLSCETSKGKIVLRIAPSDDTPKLFYEKLMMRSEPFIHELVRSQTSVPAPRILYHNFSRNIIDSDYLIMEYIDSDHSSFSLEELGGYVRQLHEITGDQYGYPGRGLHPAGSWQETILSCARNIFQDCVSCKALNRRDADWFFDKYEKYKDVFSENTCSLLHLDLWSANILCRDGHINGILDFDRGMFGDPELEFAVLDTYGMATAGFFRGYGSARPDTAEALIRQKLYLVYELIKYAFIRLARGRSRSTADYYISQCRQIFSSL